VDERKNGTGNDCFYEKETEEEENRSFEERMCEVKERWYTRTKDTRE